MHYDSLKEDAGQNFRIISVTEYGLYQTNGVDPVYLLRSHASQMGLQCLLKVS